MNILVHPTYFPCIVQMAVIAQSKKVVFETDDTYQKQTYRTRAYIAHSNGKLLLNVPIKHSADGQRQKMRDVHVENDFPWQSHHWKSLQSAYRTSPFFEYYEDDIAPLFTENVTHLLEHTISIYKVLAELIGIETHVDFTTEYFFKPEQEDYRYLAKSKEINIKVPKYTQVFEERHGFLHNLSILDLLFNEGPNTLNYLETIPLKL